MKRLTQRITDWRREQRIRRLRGLVVAYVNRGEPDSARGFLRRMSAEIEARSPDQVRRMEQRKGISHA